VIILFSHREKTHHNKRADGRAEGIGPEFKPQYQKKNLQG
jgi:hypothetical protein